MSTCTEYEQYWFVASLIVIIAAVASSGDVAVVTCASHMCYRELVFKEKERTLGISHARSLQGIETTSRHSL